MEAIDIRRNLLTVGSFVNKINNKTKYDIRSYSSSMSRALWVAQSNVTFPHNLFHQILSPPPFSSTIILKYDWIIHFIKGITIFRILLFFQRPTDFFFSSSCSANHIFLQVILPNSKVLEEHIFFLSASCLQDDW